jgi:2-dehydro-3-deoxygalactonokinase
MSVSESGSSAPSGAPRAPADGVIAIDWGSSRMRSWLLEADGTIRARRACEDGAIGLSPAGFDAVLAREVGDWAADRPGAVLIACGMVGARGAWTEAPYVDLPADVGAIRDRLAHVRTSLGRPLAIVGGLRTAEPDVLRGEETQALGTGLSDGLLCMPGTHSKWLRLRAGTVAGFATWFTGELFDLLGRHGSLAKAFGNGEGADPEGDDRVFDRGFDAGLAQALAPDADAAWLHALFGFRARVVGQGADGCGERARLSGWLLGTELRQALSHPIAAGGTGRLVLVAAPRLAALYERALDAVRAAMPEALRDRVATRFEPADADCAARGLHRIATGL